MSKRQAARNTPPAKQLIKLSTVLWISGKDAKQQESLILIRNVSDTHWVIMELHITGPSSITYYQTSKKWWYLQKKEQKWKVQTIILWNNYASIDGRSWNYGIWENENRKENVIRMYNLIGQCVLDASIFSFSSKCILREKGWRSK